MKQLGTLDVRNQSVMHLLGPGPDFLGIVGMPTGVVTLHEDHHIFFLNIGFKTSHSVCQHITGFSGFLAFYR